MASATDTFGGSGALSGNWSMGRNSMVQSSGEGLASLSGDWCSAFYTGITWTDDHYSEVTLHSSAFSAAGTFPVAWVMVRMTNAGGGGHESAYALGLTPNGSNTDVGLWRLSGGANYNSFPIATLATNIAYAAGDIFRLQVVGSTLTAYQNGVQIGTNQTDTNIASGGSPGFGEISPFAAMVDNGIDFWTGSDVGGAVTFNAAFNHFPKQAVNRASTY
jgi:hypothetical protein